MATVDGATMIHRHQPSAISHQPSAISHQPSAMGACRLLNPHRPGGVLPHEVHGLADRLTGGILTVDHDLEREFEARLTESSTLAFRVAYGVLRHRQDAEDVAQEAFVKAYRSFHQLRDRDRFRAWLVRMTWRLALDRQRGDRRRTSRHVEHEATSRPGRSGPVAQAAVDDMLARERAEHLSAAIDAL